MHCRAASGLVAVLVGGIGLLAHPDALNAQESGAPLKAKLRFESTPPAATVTVLRQDRVVIRGRTPAAFVLTWDVDEPLEIVFAVHGHEDCRRQIIIRRVNRADGVVVVQDSLEQRFPLGSLRHRDAPVVECTLQRRGRENG